MLCRGDARIAGKNVAHKNVARCPNPSVSTRLPTGRCVRAIAVATCDSRPLSTVCCTSSCSWRVVFATGPRRMATEGFRTSLSRSGWSVLTPFSRRTRYSRAHLLLICGCIRRRRSGCSPRRRGTRSGRGWTFMAPGRRVCMLASRQCCLLLQPWRRLDL